MSADSDPGPLPASPEDRLAAAEQALHALRTQQEVLAAGISHDLRAPLRAIGSYSGLIAEHHADGLGEEGRLYLQRIREAAARMDGLIDGLMQLSHASRATLRARPVDLSLLADWSLAELHDTMPELEIEATVQPDLLAMGDERQLKQVFDRLLDNACRFSGGGAPVRIQVGGERVDGRLHVHVRDQGSGFDMRYAARMFEPFQRLHPSEQGGGHGLGLAVAEVIVQRHGGRIRAESEPGSGTVFHVELPAAPEREGGA